MTNIQTLYGQNVYSSLQSQMPNIDVNSMVLTSFEEVELSSDFGSSFTISLSDEAKSIIANSAQGDENGDIVEGGDGLKSAEIVIIQGKKKTKAKWESTTNPYLYSGRTGVEENVAAMQRWAESTPEDRVRAMGMDPNAIAGEISDETMFQEIGILSEEISEIKLNLLGVKHTWLGNNEFKQIVYKHDGSFNRQENVTKKKSEFAQGFTLSKEFFQSLIIDPALKNVGNIDISYSHGSKRSRMSFTSDLGYNVGLENINQSGILVPTNKVTIVLEHFPEMGLNSWKIITAHPGDIWSN